MISEWVFCKRMYISSKITNGWELINKEANPESTICKAQTTIPLPTDKNKKPAIAVLINCFFEIFLAHIPEKAK